MNGNCPRQNYPWNVGGKLFMAEIAYRIIDENCSRRKLPLNYRIEIVSGEIAYWNVGQILSLEEITYRIIGRKLSRAKIIPGENYLRNVWRKFSLAEIAYWNIRRKLSLAEIALKIVGRTLSQKKIAYVLLEVLFLLFKKHPW